MQGEFIVSRENYGRQKLGYTQSFLIHESQFFERNWVQENSVLIWLSEENLTNSDGVHR